MSNFMRVRLELARNPGFPDGSPHHGYEFVAPLDKDGRLDPEGWRKERKACTVRRFWGEADDEHGLLVHGKAGWWFDYDSDDEDDDEPLFRLDRHTLKQGEYVSVLEHDGKLMAFKIVSVRPALAA